MTAKVDLSEKRLLEGMEKLLTLLRAGKVHQLFVIAEPETRSEEMRVYSTSCPHRAHYAHFLAIALSQVIAAGKHAGIEITMEMAQLEDEGESVKH